MKSGKKNILLLHSRKSSNKRLKQLLEKLKYNVRVVHDLESAVHVLIGKSTDLIISDQQLDGDTGFYIFNLLKDKSLLNGSSFILNLARLEKYEILLAEELGIDGFIFPPYDEDKIRNIINNYLEKKVTSGTKLHRYFKVLSKIIPLGIFEMENNSISKANDLFYEWTKTSSHESKRFMDIFNLEQREKDKVNFLRFNNGLLERCQIYNVSVKYDTLKEFDIHLIHLEEDNKVKRTIGTIVPSENYNDRDKNHLKRTYFIDKGLNYGATGDINLSDIILTNRENQILKLSSNGTPIKQIADQLGISVRTVEKHRSNIIQKTNAGNMMEAIYKINKN